MRRTWRTTRLLACAAGLAMGLAGLAGRADTQAQAQAMTEVTFVVVNNLAAPGSFPLSLSVAVLTGVILGGLGSLMGAVWGAALIVLIPTWSDDLSKAMNLSQNVQANLSIAIYGLVLIGVMLAAPRGLQGLIERVIGLGRGLRDNQQRSRGPQRPGKEEKSEP